MALKLNKLITGIPQRCIELVRDHISEALLIIFNQSLLQGIVPNIFYALIIYFFAFFTQSKHDDLRK